MKKSFIFPLVISFLGLSSLSFAVSAEDMGKPENQKDRLSYFLGQN